MRIATSCLFIALLASSGCFHKRAAAPQEGFSDVPGMPPPAPVAEVKPNPRPSKKESQSSAPISIPSEPKTPQQQLIVTPENGLVGKVEMVNQNAHYVVLSFPIGHLPALEQHLSVYRRGLKIGEVKVSGPQIEDNVVAD